MNPCVFSRVQESICDSKCVQVCSSDQKCVKQCNSMCLILSMVLKTGPGRPVQPVESGTGV
jgi:hypothetical protein